jgi:hypothetical protein
MKTPLNDSPTRHRSGAAHWRVTWLLLTVSVALVGTILWLAPLRTAADDLDNLPPPSAIELHSKAASSAPTDLPFHADAKLDHLSSEPDPSPAAIAAYER